MKSLFLSFRVLIHLVQVTTCCHCFWLCIVWVGWSDLLFHLLYSKCEFLRLLAHRLFNTAQPPGLLPWNFLKNYFSTFDTQRLSDSLFHLREPEMSNDSSPRNSAVSLMLLFLVCNSSCSDTFLKWPSSIWAASWLCSPFIEWWEILA